MAPFLRWLVSLTLLLLVCSFPAQALAQVKPAVSNKDSAMEPTFAELSRQFVLESVELSPVNATALGDHRFDALLDDLSPEARERERAFLKRWQERLATIDFTRLSREAQVDFVLLQRKLKADQWQLDEFQEWAWNPIVYTQLAGGAIYSLMARDFAPIEERLKSVTARLEQFPRMYAQVRATLDIPRVPPIHAETAVKQNRGVLSILEDQVRPQMGTLDAPARERLVKAMATATEAVNTHQTWLAETLVPQARGDFRIGREKYEQKLAFQLGAALTRTDVRERAEFELIRARAEMYSLAVKVLRARKSILPLPEQPSPEEQQQAIEAALEFAYAEIPERDGVVPAARESLKITTAFVREHDLMSLPDDPLKIIVMPEFQRGVSVAYCDSPGALEVGQETYYAVAPLPESWTDEQCRSFLREYNLRSIHNLTVHEAMPGHFVQLAWSNRHPSRLRSLLSSGTFVEGWACYTEQMLSEEGFMQDDPLMRLVTLKWYLRTIANALLDQRLHVEGIEREAAMRLMTRDTFQQEREAAGKWVRAQLTSAQLATYFVGYQEHRDLRRAMEKAWGEKFRLKRYHDQVVSYGSPPIAFVKALMLEEPVPLQ